ncbi:MAG: hypothetical protein ACM3L6_07935 [Deltaproteobacteria bacterium]
MKSRILRFCGALALWVVIFGLSVGGFYAGLRGGSGLVAALTAEARGPRPDYAFLRMRFGLGFENDKDVSAFQPHHAAARPSTEHATQGLQSLEVEFPAGDASAGIAIDLDGEECFDWSRMEALSFDAYNAASVPAPVTIRLNSGPAEPRKQFETTVTLPAQETAKVTIGRAELAPALDLGCVSGIDIFMAHPPTTYFLYFDNFRREDRG